MTSSPKNDPNGRVVLLTEAPNDLNSMQEVPVFVLRKWLDPAQKMFWYPPGSLSVADRAMTEDLDVDRTTWQWLAYKRIRFSNNRLSVVKKWKQMHQYPYASDTASESDGQVMKSGKKRKLKENSKESQKNVSNLKTGQMLKAPSSLTSRAVIPKKSSSDVKRKSAVTNISGPVSQHSSIPVKSSAPAESAIYPDPDVSKHSSIPVMSSVPAESAMYPDVSKHSSIPVSSSVSAESTMSQLFCSSFEPSMNLPQFQQTPTQFQQTPPQFQQTSPQFQQTPTQFQQTPTQFQQTPTQFQQTPQTSPSGCIRPNYLPPGIWSAEQHERRPFQYSGSQNEVHGVHLTQTNVLQYLENEDPIYTDLDDHVRTTYNNNTNLNRSSDKEDEEDKDEEDKDEEDKDEEDDEEGDNAEEDNEEDHRADVSLTLRPQNNSPDIFRTLEEKINHGAFVSNSEVAAALLRIHKDQRNHASSMNRAINNMNRCIVQLTKRLRTDPLNDGTKKTSFNLSERDELPIDDPTKLETFCKFLDDDEENRKAFKEYLVKLLRNHVNPSDSANQTVGSAAASFLDEKLTVWYSWAGKREGKPSFKKTALGQCILECVNEVFLTEKPASAWWKSFNETRKRFHGYRTPQKPE